MKVKAEERYEGSPYWVYVDRIDREIKKILETGSYQFIRKQERLNEFLVEGVTVKWLFSREGYRGGAGPGYTAHVLDIYAGQLLVFVYKGCFADSDAVPGAWWSVIAKIPAYLAGLHALQLHEIKEAEKAKEQRDEAERLRVEAEWLKARGAEK